MESEFRGQLPAQFDPPPNGTWTLPQHMNDLNQEEPSRYVQLFLIKFLLIPEVWQKYQAPLKDCHYLVDLETSHTTEREPQYSLMTTEWEIIFQVDFLDSAR